MQAWLGERLEGMGFQQRSFPPLRPLDATLGRRQRELEAAAAAAAAMPGAAAQEAAATADAEQGERGSSSSTTTRGSGGLTPCTTTTFARWAGAARGRLPLLASQWQPAGADGWDLMAAAPLLHEVHAAHGYSGAAEEHAREMIGGWVGGPGGSISAGTCEQSMPAGHWQPCSPCPHVSASAATFGVPHLV